MQVAQQFHVERPIDEVWAAFQDIPSVVQCVPGASLVEVKADGSFVGTLKVRLGPITASFEGTATVTVGPETHAGRIEASGVDKRGGSRGSAAVLYRVATAGTGSDVVIDSAITIGGTAAQFARAGLVNELASRMLRDFAACLEAKLGAQTPDEAAAVEAADLDGISMLLGSTSSWVKGKFRRDPR